MYFNNFFEFAAGYVQIQLQYSTCMVSYTHAYD